MENKPQPQPQKNEPGLYSFDGKVYRKLDPTEGKKVPVTDAAYDRLQSLRKTFQENTGVRVDLSVIVSGVVTFGEIGYLNDEAAFLKCLKDAAKKHFDDQAKKL